MIGQLKSPHPRTKQKVLEILSHVNKRIKGQNAISLPLAELVQQFKSPESAPMVRNFALVYAEMAFERAEPAAQLEAVSAAAARPARLHRLLTGCYDSPLVAHCRH